jgi:DNA-binding response OmpR family regulator
MKNILVVDDDEAIIGSIRENLQFHEYTVYSAFNGLEALSQIGHHLPDLILLDIDMPGIDGVEFCSRIREDPRWNALPIIFLTALSELPNKIAAYMVGADDYLSKPFDMRELLLRIKALLRRATSPDADKPELLPDPHHLQIGSLYLDVRSATATTENGSVSLTPTELKLLKHLMQHAEERFSSEQLLQKVWEYPPGTGDSALVRWHIKNLRCKIEPFPDQPRHLYTVSHYGYVLKA